MSLSYAIAAMVAGVFYREFTKQRGCTGITVLGKVHTHIFLPGMLVFPIVALFAAHCDLKKISSSIPPVSFSVCAGAPVWERHSGLVLFDLEFARSRFFTINRHFLRRLFSGPGYGS